MILVSSSSLSKTSVRSILLDAWDLAHVEINSRVFIHFNRSLTEPQQVRMFCFMMLCMETRDQKPAFSICSCSIKCFWRICSLKQTHSLVKRADWFGLMGRSIACRNGRVDDSISSIAFLSHLNLLLVPISAKQLKNLLLLDWGQYWALNLNKVASSGWKGRIEAWIISMLRTFSLYYCF